MQDGNAEFAVGVDVWVEEGAVELEGGRGVGVVLREVHLGFEVATVVERVWVDDDEGDVPVEDVIFVELSSKLEGVYGGGGYEWATANLNVDPLFLRKSLVLVLKDLAGCHVGSEDGMSERGQAR